ncbi:MULTISPECIES: hypothetical protein [Pseudobutyrivibrio]|uniref:Uncharacterized protein n=1 Tax=Pseudobutyrivibrio xylanivorans TaxID=185007 RepID=A0A1G5S2Q8_PSEXY|nr:MULTISPECIES: hypothetical protein [Pseudobutyrivibrio]MDC7280473.1 hypothetical protein [Butyrivibrio fibrisolvens]SCZ80140.1 hypothetical protein SAMN02910350_02140 [Pseudobutyrivibrio xylanivorans]
MDANILNSVTSNVSTTYTKPAEAKESTKDTQEVAKNEEKAGKFSEEAAVYEKSSDDTAVKSEKYSKGDRTALVQQLKADQEKMMNNLLEIVQKTIAGQGSTFAIASQDDMWKFLAEGKFTADPDTIAKAKEDISEDGYWGVEKTSDRILEFAKALSGDDPDKADELLSAFKKGYEQATGTWGKDLPDISSKTYDAVLKKFDDWKNSGKTQNTTEAAENAAKTEG